MQPGENSSTFGDALRRIPFLRATQPTRETASRPPAPTPPPALGEAGRSMCPGSMRSMRRPSARPRRSPRGRRAGAGVTRSRARSEHQPGHRFPGHRKKKPAIGGNLHCDIPATRCDICSAIRSPDPLYKTGRLKPCRMRHHCDIKRGEAAPLDVSARAGPGSMRSMRRPSARPRRSPRGRGAGGARCTPARCHRLIARPTAIRPVDAPEGRA